MISYKVWVHVEQYDEDNDENTHDLGLPEQLHEFDTEEKAFEFVTAISNLTESLREAFN